MRSSSHSIEHGSRVSFDIEARKVARLPNTCPLVTALYCCRAEATLRALSQTAEHVTGKDLSFFVPKKKLRLGQPLVLEPAASRLRPFLKGVAGWQITLRSTLKEASAVINRGCQSVCYCLSHSKVGDGEKCAIKAWKILATKCRVWFHQEDCHGYWNDVSDWVADMCLIAAAGSSDSDVACCLCQF